MTASREMTIKQKKALALMAVNGGNASKAMRDAGYTAMSAHRPQDLTKSPAVVHELVRITKKYKFTLDRVASIVNEALSATKVINFGGELIVTDVPDHITRLRAVDKVRELIRERENHQQVFIPVINNPELQDALKNADTVELQRILFNKPTLD